MPFGLQPIHLILIVFVALLIFGPTLLPQLGRSLGKTIGEFRHIGRETSRGPEDETKTPGVIPSPGASTGPQSRQNNTCTLCGTANPPQARYCSRCGIILSR